jgi:hypothetical protein
VLFTCYGLWSNCHAIHLLWACYWFNSRAIHNCYVVPNCMPFIYVVLFRGLFVLFSLFVSCVLLFRGQFVFFLPFLILDSFYVVLFTKVPS